MSIWNDGKIHEMGPSIMTNFNPEHVNPASYDISFGEEIEVVSQDVVTSEYFKTKYFNEYLLLPGERAWVTVLEELTTPINICISIRLKSSLARSMISAPLGGWIDPGFAGQISLVIINQGIESYKIEKGRRFAQYIFHELIAPAEVPYGDKTRKSHYQGSRGITKNISTL